MAKNKKEDKITIDIGDSMKPHWEVTFVAENILVQTIAIYLANNNGELPSEDLLHKMTKSSVEASVFFNKNKKKYGIHDRIYDGLDKLE